MVPAGTIVLGVGCPFTGETTKAVPLQMVAVWAGITGVVQGLQLRTRIERVLESMPQAELFKAKFLTVKLPVESNRSVIVLLPDEVELPRFPLVTVNRVPGVAGLICQ